MPRPAKHERSIAMYETILNLHTVEECVNFFEDLCAATELSAMEQRFDVASLLLEGRVYTEIMDTTKASSATVSRVNRMLNYGHGCLGEVISRTQHPEQKDCLTPLTLTAAASCRCGGGFFARIAQSRFCTLFLPFVGKAGGRWGKFSLYECVMLWYTFSIVQCKRAVSTGEAHPGLTGFTPAMAGGRISQRPHGQGHHQCGRQHEPSAE